MDDLTLDELRFRVDEHLKKYGIKKQFFASYIGIYYQQVSLWIQGKYELNKSQLKKVHDFLNWKYIEKLL